MPLPTPNAMPLSSQWLPGKVCGGGGGVAFGCGGRVGGQMGGVGGWGDGGGCVGS